jgi:hypothetical protein
LVESLTVRVTNWKEYNPRADLKRPSWFRFEAGIFLKTKNLTVFGAREIVAFGYLCSLCVDNVSDQVLVPKSHAVVFSRLTWEELLQALQCLANNDVISITAQDPAGTRSEAAQNPARTLRDVTLREDRAEAPQPAVAAGLQVSFLEPTYVPTDAEGNELKKPKKEKKPKPVKDCSLLPELEKLAAAFDGKVPKATQTAWVASYGASFVLSTIPRAYAWNAERNFRRTDLPRFYGGWLSGDWERLPSGHPFKRAPQQKKAHPFLEQMAREEAEKGNA